MFARGFAHHPKEGRPAGRLASGRPFWLETCAILLRFERILRVQIQVLKRAEAALLHALETQAVLVE